MIIVFCCDHDTISNMYQGVYSYGLPQKRPMVSYVHRTCEHVYFPTLYKEIKYDFKNA